MLKFCLDFIPPEWLQVLFAKTYDSEEKIWYYIFKNIKMSHRHENTYLEVQYKNLKDGYFSVEYDNRKDSFGTIYVQSNLDLEPTEVYQIILDRWDIETVFHREKSDLEIDCTRVHGEFATIGEEFINSIAISMYEKVCKKIEPIKGNISSINFLKSLCNVWHTVSDTLRENVQNNPQWIFNEGMLARDDGEWPFGRQEDLDKLEKLGLIKASREEQNSNENQVGDSKDELSYLYKT